MCVGFGLIKESIISVECMYLYVCVVCLFVCLFVYLFCVLTFSEEINVFQAVLTELLEEKSLPPSHLGPSLSLPHLTSSQLPHSLCGQRLHYPAWKMASIQFHKTNY